MTTTPALIDDLVREITAELLAHGEFSHIPGNNRPNAELAAKAILEIVERHQSKEIEALRSALEDGDNVHLNMLRGTIAKPSVEQIVHIYPEIAGWRDALRRLVNPAPGVKALPAWVYGIVNAALKEGA
jgi:hypothetical protein